MIVDHNYAALFDFRYSLIQNFSEQELKKKSNVSDLQRKTTSKISGEGDGEDDEEGDEEGDAEGKGGELENFDMDKFMCAEDTKTLFLIHYAFIDQKLRLDTKWLTQETFLDKGKIVGKQPVGSDSQGVGLQGGRRPIFDLQDLAIL